MMTIFFTFFSFSNDEGTVSPWRADGPLENWSCNFPLFLARLTDLDTAISAFSSTAAKWLIDRRTLHLEEPFACRVPR